MIVAIVGFWRKLFSSIRKEEPLRGVPDVRRLKTYSAESGFVYLYSFSGMRVTHRDGELGTEYVFEVTRDRKSWWPASVFLAHAALNGWMREHRKDLSASERYGMAKIALMQLFDSIESGVGPEGVTAHPGREQFSRIAETLDLL